MSDTKLDDLISRQSSNLVNLGPKLPDKGKRIQEALQRYQDEKKKRRNNPPLTLTQENERCEFEYLWVRLGLGKEMEDILKGYSRLDGTPFKELVGMEIEPIRDAIVRYLAQTLLEVSKMPFELIESKVLDEVERPFVALEKHNIHCPFIRKRLALAHEIKPAQVLHQLTQTLLRKDVIDRDLKTLDLMVQKLTSKRDAVLAGIQTLQNKIVQVDDPVALLPNTRNFLFPPP